jgi:hypothetical protein
VDNDLMHREDGFVNEIARIDGVVQVLLKGHLLLEEALSRLIDLYVYDSTYLEDARLTFKQKLNLAKALASKLGAASGWDVLTWFLTASFENEPPESLGFSVVRGCPEGSGSLPKLDVVGSIPITRSIERIVERPLPERHDLALRSAEPGTHRDADLRAALQAEHGQRHAEANGVEIPLDLREPAVHLV